MGLQLHQNAHMGVDRLPDGQPLGGLVLSFTGVDFVPFLITGGLALLLAASLLVPRVGPPRRASQPALDAHGKADRFDKRFLYMVLAPG